MIVDTGKGLAEFPDEMAPEKIEAIIARDVYGKTPAPERPAADPAAYDMLDSEGPVDVGQAPAAEPIPDPSTVMENEARMARLQAYSEVQEEVLRNYIPEAEAGGGRATATLLAAPVVTAGAGVAAGLRLLVEQDLDGAAKTFEEIASLPMDILYEKTPMGYVAKNAQDARLVGTALKPLEWIEHAGQFYGDAAEEAAGASEDAWRVGATTKTLVEGVALLGLPKLARAMLKSDWVRGLSNRERGLVAQDVVNMKKSGLSEAEILKELRKQGRMGEHEALKQQMIQRDRRQFEEAGGMTEKPAEPKAAPKAAPKEEPIVPEPPPKPKPKEQGASKREAEVKKEFEDRFLSKSDADTYTTPTPESIRVPVAKLSIRESPIDPEKKKRAEGYMDKAEAEGGDTRRKPISVFERGDGTYKVLDGNTTTAVLQDRGVKEVNVVVKKTLKQMTEKDLDAVYEQAKEAQADQVKLTNTWAEETGAVEAKFRQELKDKARAAEKAEEKGDPATLKDVVASTLIYDTPEQVSAAAKKLAGRPEVMDIRDRFESPLPTGYRDVAMIVAMPNGHLTEVQLTTRRMFEAKEDGPGHKLYEGLRQIDELLSKNNNGKLSKPLTKREINDLKSVAKMLTDVSKSFYDGVFQNSAANALALSSEQRSALSGIEAQLRGLSIFTNRLPSIRKRLKPLSVSSRMKAVPSQSKKDRSPIKSPPSEPNVTAAKPIVNSQPKHKSLGRKGKLYIAGKDPVPMRFALFEAGDLIPSHKPGTFAKHPDYPEGIQPRAYHYNKDLQLNVRQRAQNLKPELVANTAPTAETGPPIVLPGGVVLGGNSRTMMLQTAYNSHPGPASAYIDWLIEHAEEYGLNKNQIKVMRQPVLVRVTYTEDISAKSLHRLASDLNKGEMAGMSDAEAAASAGADISVRTLERIGAELAERGKSLREHMAGKEGPNLLDLFVRDGIITPAERTRYVSTTTGALNSKGKDLIENTIMGAVIPDADLLDTAINNVKAAVNKIGRALTPIAELKSRGGKWGFTADIPAAVAIAANMKIGGIGSVEDFAAQQSLFAGDEYTDRQLIIAKRLITDGPKKWAERWKGLAMDAKTDPKNQLTMFKPRDPEASFAEHFGALENRRRPSDDGGLKVAETTMVYRGGGSMAPPQFSFDVERRRSGKIEIGANYGRGIYLTQREGEYLPKTGHYAKIQLDLDKPLDLTNAGSRKKTLEFYKGLSALIRKGDAKLAGRMARMISEEKMPDHLKNSPGTVEWYKKQDKEFLDRLKNGHPKLADEIDGAIDYFVESGHSLNGLTENIQLALGSNWMEAMWEHARRQGYDGARFVPEKFPGPWWMVWDPKKLKVTSYAVFKEGRHYENVVNQKQLDLWNKRAGELQKTLWSELNLKPNISAPQGKSVPFPAYEGAGVVTLAQKIRKNFKAAKGVTLHGEKIKTLEDLAVAAQVFRDPRYETSRIFYLKGDTIIGHEFYTSRLPGMSTLYPKTIPIKGKGTPIAKRAAEMRSRMKRMGADGYVFVHNHPSGNPTPSSADFSSTSGMRKAVPGFKGAIVINSGKYSAWTFVDNKPPGEDAVWYANSEKIPGLPDNWEDPLFYRPHKLPDNVREWVGATLKGTDDVAKIAKSIHTPDDKIILVHRGSEGGVRAIQEVPVKLIANKDPKKAADFLIHTARRFGAHNAIAYYKGFINNIGNPSREVVRRLSELIRKGTLLSAVFEDAATGRISDLGTGALDSTFMRDPAAAVYVKEDPTPFGQNPKDVFTHDLPKPGKKLKGKPLGSKIWDDYIIHNAQKLLEKIPGGKAINRAFDYDYRSNLPNAAGYLAGREEMLRYQTIAREYAIGLGQRLQAEPEESQLRMGEAIRGEDVKLSAKESRLVFEAKRSLYELGRQAVDLDLLSQETFFKNAGRYMPRLYTSKEYQSLLSLFKLAKPNRLDLSRFKRRKDIPKEIREAMGEILTPGYPVAKGITQLSHDVEMARWFRGIANNPEWALPAKAMEAMKRPHSQGQLNDVDYSAFEKLPDDKRLGDLAGAYVHPEIYFDLMETVKMMDRGPASKYWRKFLGYWKFGKVIISPKTHMRNMMSNSVLAHLGGMPMYVQPKYLGMAAVELKNKGARWLEAKRLGLLDATFTNAELRSLFDQVQTDMGGTAAGSLPDQLGAMGKGLAGMRKAGATAARIYELEEQWFKLAKFIHNIDKRGMSPEAAYKDAERWLFNYSRVTRFQDQYRTHVLGAPFATFTFKAIPRIAEAAITAPWRFALPGAMIYALEEAARWAIQDDDEAEKAKRQLRPEYMQGRFMGIPNFARVRFVDEYGREYWLNLTYTLPWGDIAERGGWGPFPSGLRPMGMPLVSTMAELFTNQDMFWREDIFKDEDFAGLEAMDKAKVTAMIGGKYLLQELAPTPAIDIHKAVQALQVRPDYQGRVRPGPIVALDVLLGLKMYPVDYAEQFERQYREKHPSTGKEARIIRWDIKNLYLRRAVVIQRGGDPTYYDDQIRHKIKQLQGLGKEISETAEVYSKTVEGGSK